MPRRASARWWTASTSRSRARTTRADPFPTPSKLLTIDKDFGGWSEANTKFFDEEDGLVTKIQQETGKE